MLKQRPVASQQWANALQAQTSFVRQCANHLLGDYEAAKDLAQDVLLHALERESMYHNDGNLRGWLRTVTRNLFINNYRKERKQKFVGEPTDQLCYEQANYSAIARNDGQYSYDMELIDALIVKHVQHSSKYNPERVLRLRMDGYQYEDIANELNMPIGSVRSALFRARSVLADKIGTSSQ